MKQKLLTAEVFIRSVSGRKVGEYTRLVQCVKPENKTKTPCSQSSWRIRVDVTCGQTELTFVFEGQRGWLNTSTLEPQR